MQKKKENERQTKKEGKTMKDLMRSAHLLATDPLFRTACGADPRSALAQRGLVLTRAELKAFSRVWTLITGGIDGDDSSPIDIPNGNWWPLSLNPSSAS